MKSKKQKQIEEIQTLIEGLETTIESLEDLKSVS